MMKHPGDLHLWLVAFLLMSDVGSAIRVHPNKKDPIYHDVFEDIASHSSARAEAKWSSNETISGKASTMDATKNVRKCLGKWIKQYNIKSFLDIPCGDANWQREIPGIHDIVYKGYDIAETAVKIARRKNKKYPNMTFGVMNLIDSVPPEKPDLFLMKDVLMHLPLDAGRRMLVNAKRSGARYIAVTTFNRAASNRNITFGPHRNNFYTNNVHKAPFLMPKGVEECKHAWGKSQRGRSRDDVSLELIDLSQWVG
eukprot:gnl/TRDRNA2_/TRDRNA2_175841_c2_seq20.p1 gnl/TRDRNA2_/TRDRNA2_175841_c2~~gnl/TRDRNA2_/TRDRNA2_175841_c2_seq20.p1  ORF type:complete len:254 (-),score=31.03 gnl/TRDRNA2_/TRDRNA2_175841_c2_seq20:343-1104(-)